MKLYTIYQILSLPMTLNDWFQGHGILQRRTSQNSAFYIDQ